MNSHKATRRLTIDVSSEMHHRIQEKARNRDQTIQEYISEAILSDIDPAIAFLAPDDADFEQLDDFLGDAKEAVFLGTTLRSIWQKKEFSTKLLSLAEHGCRLSFLTIDPGLMNDSNGTERIRIIEELRGPRHQSSVIKEARQTLEFCGQLYEMASTHQYQNTVKAFTTKKIPRIGLVIKDPLQRNSRMRVSLLVHEYVNECDPTISLSLDRRGARNAYDTLYRHYVYAMRDSDEVDLRNRVLPTVSPSLCQLS